MASQPQSLYAKPFAETSAEGVAAFDRHFFDGKEPFTRIGTGSLGGKAHGMAIMRPALAAFAARHPSPQITVAVPTLTVIATDMFELFMKHNDLEEVINSDVPDDRIAHAFQKAELPPLLVGELRALIAQVHTPLAIRSSSYLEDAMYQPFASVYTTKMIPNNQHDTDTRFRKLVEAIKFVYASTYFRGAKNYMQATEHSTAEERMAVIIQAIVGERHGDRFYPEISGVARSYNFYSFGHAKPEDGVVDLALGLGRTIVSEGCAWSYSPAYPRTFPPHNSPRDLIKQTQSEFWAVNMGPPPPFDPIKETEYMSRYNLSDAEKDGALAYLASTYDGQNDRIEVGISTQGPRILTFAPILDYGQIPLNQTIKDLLALCEDEIEHPVEIEFALTMKGGAEARFGFLQVRPMVVSDTEITVSHVELDSEDVLLSSQNTLGNGEIAGISDIVYVKKDTFDILKTQQIAGEVESINRRLTSANRPYLLMGFGRWGTSDPSYGIPADFGQIAGAKAIVESELPGMHVALSQGSHFFHNITSFRILYFSLPQSEAQSIDWDWLNAQQLIEETSFVRWSRTSKPLTIRVDGRSGLGVIHR